MKKILCTLLSPLLCAHLCAAELFPDGQPDAYQQQSPLENPSTVGGYAIYPGQGDWRIASLALQKTGALGTAEALSLGTVALEQFGPGGEWLAGMWLAANLVNVSTNQYMTGSPCSGGHLIAVNKGRGRDDNCLTVDPDRAQIGGRTVPLMLVRISQAKSAGRLYKVALALNMELLGFPDARPEDWTAQAVQTSPQRKAVVEQLQQWAEALQDGSARAIDFSKPQDAFAKVPSYLTLMQVPANLADGTFPQAFQAAVLATRDKPGFKAIAYSRISPQNFRWQNRYGMGDQESADRQALESCESGRPASAPQCRLYDLGGGAKPAPQ